MQSQVYQIDQPCMLVLIYDLSSRSRLGDFESQLEVRYLNYALNITVFALKVTLLVCKLSLDLVPSSLLVGKVG